MKIRMNPILKKDVKVTSRSMRMSWGIFVYELILVIIFILMVTVIFRKPSSFDMSNDNRYSQLVAIFPVLSITQIVISALIIPIITASSISGEKERQTFDIMITTAISPFSIIFGKVSSAVLRMMLYIVGSIPIMALSFVLGGLKWVTLFLFIITYLIFAVFEGSIGIFCSSVCRKSITSIILAYVINGVVMFLTELPLIISTVSGFMYRKNSMGEILLPLLFNPIIFFEEFYMKIMSGMSGASLVNNYGDTYIGNITMWFSEGNRWIYASGLMIILMACMFMLFAAKRINPLKGKVVYVKSKVQKAD